MGRYNTFITCVSQMEEAYGMKLLKLYPFFVMVEHKKDEEVKPWFTHLMKELATIPQYQPDDQHRIHLIEKYDYLIHQACYDLNAVREVCGLLSTSGLHLHALSMESANYGLKKKAILIAVQDTRRSRINLQNLSEELRNDKDIVLAAVNHSPLEFEFASSELKRDPDVILAAAKHSSAFSLRYVDTDLRDCKELMLKVIRLRNCRAKEYQYLSERLQSDRDIILKLVAKDHFFYADMPAVLKKDEDFVRQCIVTNPKVMRHVHNDKITDDKEFILANPNITKHLLLRC